jgi:hypothetical protein
MPTEAELEATWGAERSATAPHAQFPSAQCVAMMAVRCHAAGSGESVEMDGRRYGSLAVPVVRDASDSDEYEEVFIPDEGPASYECEEPQDNDC